MIYHQLLKMLEQIVGLLTPPETLIQHHQTVREQPFSIADWTESSFKISRDDTDIINSWDYDGYIEWDINALYDYKTIMKSTSPQRFLKISNVRGQMNLYLEPTRASIKRCALLIYFIKWRIIFNADRKCCRVIK